MRKLIGITGKAGAGKDTLANVFIQSGFTRMAFADVLKEITGMLAAEPAYLYHDRDAKEEFCDALGMTRRSALQKVGNGMRGILGDDVWVKRLITHWVKRGHIPTIITDVRYENEAQAISDARGLVIRVVRPDNVGLTGEAAAHISEQALPDDLIDVEVANDGTIGELRAEGRKILQMLLEGTSENEA